METIVTITAREERHIYAAKESIRVQRSFLEDYIRKDPFFMLTLDPYDSEADDAPDIVNDDRMRQCLWHRSMASVAGVIAKLPVLSMMAKRCDLCRRR